MAERYLLRGEHTVVVTRRHWVKLTGPAVAVTLALALTLWVAASGTVGNGLNLVLVLLGMVAAWAGWRWLEWRKEWFIATDRRLLRTYGILTQRVAMMPLAKVTDMSYDRSILGRLLGYGQFVMESAGQDQALSEITFVPDPDEKYQAMCETIFGREISDPGEDGVHWEDGYDDDQVRDEGRHWEPVDRSQLPYDWEWVGEEARGARAATRRRVAVDPDPTPLR